MRLEELVEVLTRYTDVNVVINLNGHAYSVTLANAKATRKDNVVLDVMLLDSSLKHFYNILRPLKVTRGSYANLNN
jgi:hypothetical protein